MTISFPEDKTGPKLFQEYLIQRGISPQTVERAGLRLVSRDQANELLRHQKPTQYRHFLAIPFPDSDYCVLRGLGDLVGTFQGVEGVKTNKLLCPKGPVEVYKPPIIDWDNFNGDLYLCESAIKALVMAQHGYAAIGGNGVSGLYTNAGFVRGFPTDLLDGGVVKRVIILFDANWQTNVEVQAAIRKLATGIQYAHPSTPVFHKQLPLTDGGQDQGIDDFFVAEGPETVKQFLATDEVGLVAVECNDRNKHFDALNEKYAITEYPGGIWNRKYRRRVTKHEMCEVLEGWRTYIEEVRSGKGTRKVEMSAPKEWFKWDGATRAERLVYLPGQPEMGVDDSGTTFYNTFRDDGVEPVAPDPGVGAEEWVEPFLRVYKNAAPDDVERRLLIQSCAWILQNRGKRMTKCFCLIGPDQGTGKSMFTEIMSACLGGDNSSFVSPHNFGNNFNANIVNKEMVVIDDLVELRTQAKGLFKNFVTGSRFTAENKGIDAYTVEATATLFITSNEFAAIPLDPEDRRVHIVTFAPTEHHEQGSAWWTEFVSWLDSPETQGYGRVRWWLEQLDLEGFDPNFMPPLTRTKRHMLDSSMDDVEHWVDALWNNMEEELRGNKRSYYTIDELAMLHVGAAWGSMDTSDRASVIRKLGVFLPKRFHRVGAAGIRTAAGRLRYWAIADTEDSVDKVKADVKKYPTIKFE